MVTGFEEHTCDLNEEEIALVPELKKVFEKFLSYPMEIKSKDLIEQINYFLAGREDYRLTDTKLRKFCNYFRSTGELPILANSNGYYISYDKNEICKQVQSLDERANSIRNAADGLRRFLI